MGHQLSNPIGIAAGFDKHGEAISGLSNIGFGFVEIGSVTPLPQEGNPRPRVFRLKEDSALINRYADCFNINIFSYLLFVFRYGFNSDGYSIVFERIQSMRELQPSAPSMIGINLGKNKHSSSAVNDYVSGVETFAPVADYIVINISSPNTPGLRSLQSESDLKQLLQNVLAARGKISNHVPIVLKLAPDLNDTELSEIANVIGRKDCAVDGLIVSNTTIDRKSSLCSISASEIGGLSGAPLAARSTEMIGCMYRLTKGRVPIIGVGGVFTGQDAYEKILAGASVVQIYTSFAYHGPPVVQKIKMELDALLTENGYNSVVEAVGKGIK